MINYNDKIHVNKKKRQKKKDRLHHDPFPQFKTRHSMFFFFHSTSIILSSFYSTSVTPFLPGLSVHTNFILPSHVGPQMR